MLFSYQLREQHCCCFPWRCYCCYGSPIGVVSGVHCQQFLQSFCFLYISFSNHNYKVSWKIRKIMMNLYNDDEKAAKLNILPITYNYHWSGVTEMLAVNTVDFFHCFSCISVYSHMGFWFFSLTQGYGLQSIINVQWKLYFNCLII